MTKVPPPEMKEQDLYLLVFDATKKLMHTDQTRQLSNKYLMAANMDGNYTDVEHMNMDMLVKVYQEI